MAKTWKEHERRTARRLSGTRTGNTGKPAADVQAGAFAVAGAILTGDADMTRFEATADAPEGCSHE